MPKKIKDDIIDIINKNKTRGIQSRIAKKIGISRVYVSMILNRKSNNDSMKLKIAEAFIDLKKEDKNLSKKIHKSLNLIINK
jgi:hypothetical protein